MTVETFEKQMRLLRRRYRPLSLSQAFRVLHGESAAEHGVVVTFDDGYRTVLTKALPLLRKYDVPAAVFVSPGLIGSPAPSLWTDIVARSVYRSPALPQSFAAPGVSLPAGSPEEKRIATSRLVSSLRNLPPGELEKRTAELSNCVADIPLDPVERERYEMLTWPELKEMRASGIEVGSHTIRHTVLASLDAEGSRQTVLESKRILELQLGEPCEFFAYPHGAQGDWSAEHEAMLIRAGYKAAFTQIPGKNKPGSNPFAIRRFNVDERTDLLALDAALSGTRDIFRRTPRILTAGPIAACRPRSWR